MYIFGLSPFPMEKAFLQVPKPQTLLKPTANAANQRSSPKSTWNLAKRTYPVPESGNVADDPKDTRDDQ